MRNSKEIEMTYTNWAVEDIILDLARLINDGFKVMSYSYTHSLRDMDVTVRLVEVYKY